MPERIQLSRQKGWRKPAGAVVVSRPSKWGNPFRVVPVRASGPFDVMAGRVFVAQSTGLADARRIAVERFERHARMWSQDKMREMRAVLAGHDLACWCPLDHPCHADVLLRLANAPEAGRG